MSYQWQSKFLLSLLPASAVGMLIQAIIAMHAPQSDIGRQYLLSLNDLFELEFIFMHSAIFFEMRRTIKPQLGQVAFVTALFFIYGLFVFPFAAKNLWIGANYILLTFSRIVYSENPIAHTEFYKALNDGAKKIIPMVLALLKMGAIFLLIPLLALLIPLPDGNLNTEEVMTLFPKHNAPQDFILLVKMFLIYFALMTAVDIKKYFKAKKRTAVTVSEYKKSTLA